MFEALLSPFLVPFDGDFSSTDALTQPPSNAPGKKSCRKKRKKLTQRLHNLQRRLYAQDKFSLLLVFQAMDAAGKDGTIRAVMSGVDPAGCQVSSFKKPSAEELDHDFLWRTSKQLPERGRIGIFNRSYYEEVLVVRVHPGILEYQKLPYRINEDTIWQERYQSILEHERHLARAGTVILKFWLNVSRNEQARRLVSRLEDSEKRWKFSPGDLDERDHWDDYQAAFEEAIAATSRPWAPWYAIPADSKPYMRMVVAETIVKTLESLPLEYPKGKEITAEEVELYRGRLLRSNLKQPNG